jgi:hypothetical protein
VAGTTDPLESVINSTFALLPFVSAAALECGDPQLAAESFASAEAIGSLVVWASWHDQSIATQKMDKFR